MTHHGNEDSKIPSYKIQDFSDINQDDPNAVVVGLAPEKFNHQCLSNAFRLIKEKNAPLIAINKARYIATSEGLSLGPGCFVSGLEYSADIKAEVIGKPEQSFFNTAFEKLNSNLNNKLDPKGQYIRNMLTTQVNM